MPCLFRAPAMTFRFKSYMPYRVPAMLIQYHVLREIPRGSQKYPSCYSNILMNHLMCSLLIPHFTLVRMDRCDKYVIVAWELYLIAEEGEWMKRKYWIHKVFWAGEEEGEFYSLFGRLKDDRQQLFKYIRMIVSKFENLEQLSHTDI